MYIVFSLFVQRIDRNEKIKYTFICEYELVVFILIYKSIVGSYCITTYSQVQRDT